MSEIKKVNKKLKLDIFIPLHTCSCQWVNFMNQVFNIITPYKKYIIHETKSLNSKEAIEKNLFQNCVVIREKLLQQFMNLKENYQRYLMNLEYLSHN